MKYLIIHKNSIPHTTIHYTDIESLVKQLESKGLNYTSDSVSKIISQPSPLIINLN